MIEVICKEDTFFVRGTFSFGIMGTFTNEAFTDAGEIIIHDTLPDILEELENADAFYYQPLFPYLQGKTDGADIAKGLEAYYNQKEKEAQQHSKQINDCVWFHLFEGLEGCAYPFWEIAQAVLPERLVGVDLERIYQTEQGISDLWEAFWEKPNDDTVEKPDVEGKLREMYPMFNFDGLYDAIVPQGMVLHGRFIEVQCSDSWGGDLFCGAYDRFDEHFTSCEWNNH